ncbi:hypothetical protein D9M71_575070 [compost metagenome]
MALAVLTLRIRGSNSASAYVCNWSATACASNPGSARTSKSNSHSAGTMFSALPPLITPVCTVENGGSKRSS